jgi:hypothetical protein
VVAAVPSLRETVLSKLNGGPDDYEPPVHTSEPTGSDTPLA